MQFPVMLVPLIYLYVEKYMINTDFFKQLTIFLSF